MRPLVLYNKYEPVGDLLLATIDPDFAFLKDGDVRFIDCKSPGVYSDISECLLAKAAQSGEQFHRFVQTLPGLPDLLSLWASAKAMRFAFKEGGYETTFERIHSQIDLIYGHCNFEVCTTDVISFFFQEGVLAKQEQVA